jgi:gp32 DNA binding protein like
MARTKREKREKKRKAAGSARFREKSRGRGADLFTLPEGAELFNLESTGTFNLDIIPYEVGEGNPNAEEGSTYWERGFWIHRDIGVNNEWVVCPAQTLKKPCPICEFRAKLADDPDVDEKVVDALKPSERMIMNVINLKKDSGKVMLWHISYAYFGNAMQQALSAEYEDEEENMDFFFEAEEGYYVKCQVEKGWQGRGFEVTRADFKERKEDLDDDILDKAVCLDEVLRIRDYDELKELLMGGMSDDEEPEEDEDEKPSRSSRRNRRKKDEDEDEDEKPSRRSRSRRKKDEDEEPEEDEDEKPSRSSRRSRKKEEEEDEDEEPEPDVDEDLDLMDYEELVDYMKDKDISIKGYKKMDEDELREAIEEELKEEPEEEPEERPRTRRRKKR